MKHSMRHYFRIFERILTFIQYNFYSIDILFLIQETNDILKAKENIRDSHICNIIYKL